MKRIGLITFLATLGVIVLHLSLYLFHAGFMDSIEAKTYDMRFKVMRGPIPHNEDIAIIAIDEKSIKEIGRFPWSRTNYVPLLDNLKKAGAKAVLMDAFFPEEESSDADKAFAEAIRRSGFVVLATAFDFNPDGSIGPQTISLPIFTDAAAGTAHINFLPDVDGVNRWTRLVMPKADGGFYPSLGMKGAMIARGADDFKVEDIDVIIGDTVIPTSFDHMMLVNYSGPPNTYEYFSFVDIAKGRVPQEKLKGRILYMGATALGIYDMRVSPFHHNTPGVEINATIADNIIRGDFIERGGVEAILDMISIIVLGMAVYLVTLRLKPFVALPLTVGILVGYIIFAYSMFLAGSWLSMVYPVTTVILAYSITWYTRFLLLERKAKEMRSMFSSYVSRKVVDQIVKNPEAAQIGGDLKQITILFSDVKGYTSFSEKRTPREVITRLNEYLGEMAGVIIDGDGTLDKFLGDGIMAYWGAPLAQPDHEGHAVECTVRMLERMKELQRKWIAEGSEPFSFRVGIHSGEVVAGNVGAEGKKMEYTVIGDTANLSSRLESTAKIYGITVLVSEVTYNATKERFVFRELDSIKVVGRTQPIKVYELIWRKDGTVSDDALSDIGRFEAALELYRSRKFEDALDTFRMLRDKHPDDAASALYLSRCESFIAEPPPEEWDGVYTRTSK